MSIVNTLEEVKSYIGDLKRKYKFKKAQLARDAAVELQVTLSQCRGKLEICKKDLSRTVNAQSRNIVDGKSKGTDTLIQEQMLWDAAIGYMLVIDAIYALETINSYDAVSHAYEMLDAAMKQIGKKNPNFPSKMHVGTTKERNAFGYITSQAALQEKEVMLNKFFEALKAEGNIEKQLQLLRSGAAQQPQTAPSSEMDDYRARMANARTSVREELDEDLSVLQDYTPPADQE